MNKNNMLQDDLNEQRELLCQKIHALKMASITATEAAVKFQLEIQLSELENERNHIDKQLAEIERVSEKHPYFSLSAFQEEDAEFFFGRESYINELVQAVKNHSVVTVIGSSGCGKSSIVFAGLKPRLRKEGSWLITQFSPGNDPFDELGKSLDSLLTDYNRQKSLLSDIQQFSPKKPDVNTLIEEIASPQSSNVEELRKKIKRFRHGEPILRNIFEAIAHIAHRFKLLVIADQFEELYTLCDDKNLQQQFLRELLVYESFPDFVKLVITLRADFLNKILKEPSSVGIIQTPSEKKDRIRTLFILPMELPDLRAVIVKPAEKFNLNIEGGLTDRILNDIAKEPGNLPLLEFTLTLLWKSSVDNILTHTAYNEIGGVAKALSRYAEKIYNDLSIEEQKQARYIFVQLVQPGEETEDVRRTAARHEIGEKYWNLIITKLSASRLVVTEAEEKVTLAHEVLLKEWQRLREWMQTDREFRTWQDHFRLAMRQWKKNDQEEGSLLRGKPLLEAKHWQDQRREDLNEEERKFIQESTIIEEKYRISEKRSILLELGKKIVTNIQLSENEISQIIYQSASKLIDTRNIYIALYDEDKDSIRFVLAFRDGQPINIEPRILSHGRIKEVITTGKPIFIRTREDSKNWDEPPGQAEFIGEPLASWIGVPIRLGDKVIGIIAAYHPFKDYAYDEGDLELLQHIADLATIALENARLYSETVRLYSEKEQQTKELQAAQNRIAEAQDVITRSRLAADFMHRLNNLTGTIPVWADLIKEKTEEFVGKIKDDVRKIQKDAEEISIVYHEENVDVCMILQTIVNQIQVQYRQEVQAKQLIIEEKIASDLYQVRGIYSTLANGIFNVITNGIESILQKGDGTLAVKANNYRDDASKEYVKIVIQDSGQGIPSIYRSKLFTLSFSTKGQRGYGLWSTKTDINRFGGEIELTSTQEGIGTTFTIVLPRTLQEK